MVGRNKHLEVFLKDLCMRHTSLSRFYKPAHILRREPHIHQYPVHALRNQQEQDNRPH